MFLWLAGSGPGALKPPNFVKPKLINLTIKAVVICLLQLDINKGRDKNQRQYSCYKYFHGGINE